VVSTITPTLSLYNTLPSILFIGNFSNQLIGIPYLFNNNFSIDGERNHLNIRKDGRVVYTAVRDNMNLLMVDINNPIVPEEPPKSLTIIRRAKPSEMETIPQYQADLQSAREELAMIQRHVRTNFDSDLETIVLPDNDTNDDEDMPALIKDSRDEDDDDPRSPLIGAPEARDERLKMKYPPSGDASTGKYKNPRVSSSDSKA